MKIGIIDNYDQDLIETLKFLDFEFYYFLLDSNERRRYYNVFFLPFNELENKYDELYVILNLSEININLNKVVNRIIDLNLLDRNKLCIYREEKVYFDNVIYFPHVINNLKINDKLDKIIESKTKKTILILCDKISVEVVGTISFLANDFEIYIYGILDFQTSNSKNIYFIKRKLDFFELIKLLSYSDIILDFSKDKFYKELLYAAFLGKQILTVKKFKNFSRLVINENIKKLVFSHMKKKQKYDISENLLENAKEIIKKELERLLKVISTNQEINI